VSERAAGPAEERQGGARRISRRALLAWSAAAGGGLIGVRPTRADQPVIVAGPTRPYGPFRANAAISIGVIGEFETANPYLTGVSSLSAEPLSGIMEGLVAYDSRQLLHPGLADGFEISEDGLSYAFHLRPNVRFHNGDTLTSADVVASWRMLTNRAFPAASRVGWDQIATIDAPDPLTAIIKTTTPSGPFLSSIAAGAFDAYAIVPSSLLAKGWHRFSELDVPVGTGPYQVSSWTSTKVTLDRFAGYWAGPAALERIVVRAYRDDDAQFAALERGDIQIAHRIGKPGASRVQQAAAMAKLAVLGVPGNAWAHLDLKQVDLLRDKRVRQALDYATPTEAIISGILGGEAVRAYADQQPGSWAFQNSGEPRPYSLTRARERLKAAGLRANDDGIMTRDGVDLAIELWGDKADPAAKPILNAIAASWAKIGVRASVHLGRASEIWSADGYQFNGKMTAGYYRWTNYNDPDDRYYWHSASIPARPGAPGGNAPAYFHPYEFQAQIDDLTARAATETDQARRKALYWQIQDLLHDEVPAIFLFWDVRYAACTADVAGFWPSSFTNLLWNAREWQRAQH
jgi:peptide/nickel transport system substrate-binding protein